MIKRTGLVAASAIVAMGAFTGCLPFRTDTADEAQDIVGGRPYAITEAPWQVSLQSGSHFCGGSILSETWILTAQHCTVGGTPRTVVAGVDRLSDSQGQEIVVSQIIRFPGYVDADKGKDVALLRLNNPLVLDGQRVRAIPYADARFVEAGAERPGEISTITGWGALREGGGGSDQLQGVEVPIIANEDGAAAYARVGVTLLPDMILSGEKAGGEDSCQGDSGGPMVVKNPLGEGSVLVGVVSFGEGCARAEFPGVYARVSAFATWIAEHVGDQPPPPPPPGGGLVINEILADPPAGFDSNMDGVSDPRDDEFIELYNAGDAALDLSDAAISDWFGERGRLPSGTTLEPGKALVVFGSDFTLGLSNGGDTVTVTASDGTELAKVEYGSEGGDDQSLVRTTEGTNSEFIGHLSVSDKPASPGTRADGTPF